MGQIIFPYVTQGRLHIECDVRARQLGLSRNFPDADVRGKAQDWKKLTYLEWVGISKYWRTGGLESWAENDAGNFGLGQNRNGFELQALTNISGLTGWTFLFGKYLRLYSRRQTKAGRNRGQGGQLAGDFSDWGEKMKNACQKHKIIPLDGSLRWKLK